MIKIAICDDEKQFIDKLVTTIKEYWEENDIKFEIQAFDNGRQLLDAYESGQKYDIIYLDINMEGMNGLEIAKEIRKLDTETNIIFSTAFVKYSLEGYQVNATRYLVKVDPKYIGQIKESLDASLERINYKPKIVEMKFREGTKNVNLDRLMYIESMLHTLTFFMQNGEKYTMYGTLNSVINSLSDDFVRTHQSFLVNIRHVESLTRTDILLDDGRKLPVARAKFKEVSSSFAKYEGML